MLGYKKLKLDIAAYDMDAYKPIVQKKVCEWYYGPTKMGKTWLAMEELGFKLKMNQPFPEQVYNKDSSNFQWWENYNGQNCVLVDEIALGATGKMMNYLKKWTDKLPCMVEIKGGQTWMKATKFAFTSQHSIDEVFEKAIEKKEVSKEDVRALKRRISMYHIN